MLYLIATSVPFTPNISELSQKTEISRPAIVEYLKHLENAQLIINFHYKARGYSKLAKPDKIYLNNVQSSLLIQNSKSKIYNLIFYL